MLPPKTQARSPVPPVYRPTIQPKANQMAPPVYCPQPIQRAQPVNPRPLSNALSHAATAPKVYRPEQQPRVRPVAFAFKPFSNQTESAVQLARRARGAMGKQTPWKLWTDWSYIRGHFKYYGADNGSIDWLSVAEKVRFEYPPKIGHESKTPGKDHYDQHVMGALNTYIGKLKENLSMVQGVPEGKSQKLSYWKQRYDIA